MLVSPLGLFNIFFIQEIDLHFAKAKRGYSQTSKMENFAIVLNSFYPLTIVAKLSNLDAARCPGYTSLNKPFNAKSLPHIEFSQFFLIVNHLTDFWQ